MENITNTNLKKWVWLTVLILVVIFVYAGVFKGFKPLIKQPIKIGVIMPLTGSASIYGQPVKKALDLAVAKAKTDYHVDFQLIYEDSQIDPKLAISAIQKLINIDGVKYVIGFSGGETLAMCPVADANKVILLTSASSPSVTTECGDYTFRDSPSDTYQGLILANKITEKDYKKVAVLFINNSYGVGLKNEFIKDYKGIVTNIESHEPNASDFRTQLTKIKAGQPEVIVLISQIFEGSIILGQKEKLDINQPIFASETLKDPNLFNLNKLLLQNLYISSLGQYEGQEYKDFNNIYQQKYGSPFGAYSDYEYDNILTLASAISKCQISSNNDCVKDEIYKTNIIGATGVINFDQNGDRINKDYTLYKVENNNFLPVE